MTNKISAVALMRPLLTYLRLPVLLSIVAFSSAAKAQDYAEMLMKAAGVPSLDAFLPHSYDVPKTAPLVIDGLWNISIINKKIRIEQGRAIVIDPWLHLFVLKVNKGMVVVRDIKQVNVGQYSGYDLPLLGPSTMSLKPNGNIDVHVDGTFGPVKFELQQRELSYPQHMQQELAAMAQMRGGYQPMQPQQSYPQTYPQQPQPQLHPQTVQSPPPQTHPGYQQPATQPVQVPPQPQPVQAPPPPQPVYTSPQPPSQTVPAADCTPIGIDPDSGATICA
ncbi:hypothetical protein EY643_11645 [Halioglobus maricola]|uniref:Uncharacterized protein n=1 Tax=Halioglobus maricola TaxID=2601894 RepID=A0A5P9NK85_9GAMM|nr:hypothetical protein [Halioglobus maricola]QFU76261.1 hypothetical protein EY643_11645 [Halioglobus maricola]